jgi:hypothetical protein
MWHSRLSDSLALDTEMLVFQLLWIRTIDMSDGINIPPRYTVALPQPRCERVQSYTAFKHDVIIQDKSSLDIKFG